MAEMQFRNIPLFAPSAVQFRGGFRMKRAASS